MTPNYHPLDLVEEVQGIAKVLRETADRLIGLSANFAATRETMDRIVGVVCSLWDVTPESIFGSSHARSHSIPRQVVASLFVDVTRASFSKTARLMGLACHGTISHAIQAVSDACATEPAFRARYHQARAALGL